MKLSLVFFFFLKKWDKRCQILISILCKETSSEILRKWFQKWKKKKFFLHITVQQGEQNQNHIDQPYAQ